MKGGRVEIAEGGGRVVRIGKVSGVFKEPIASANDELVGCFGGFSD